MKKILFILFLLSACNSFNDNNQKEESKVETKIEVVKQEEVKQETVELQTEKQEEAKQEEKNEEESKEEVKEEVKEEAKQEEKNKKVVYLTFDDGPSKNNTIEILNILNKNNIKGTFFVIGQNPEIYKKIVDEGHTIAIHTYSHKYKEVYASEENYFADLYKLEKLIYETTGQKPKVVRLPGGSSNNKANKKLKMAILNRLTNEGYVYQDWNCDSADSRKNLVDVETIVNNSYCPLKKVNLLMHDTAIKTTTVEALQRIIDKYREEGYEFKTLDVNSPKFQHVKIKK